MENDEIFIRTIEVQTSKPEHKGLIEGIQKTAGTFDMPVDVVNSAVKLDWGHDKTPKDEPATFEKLLGKTNALIKTIANNLSESVEDVKNLSEMEIEFSLGFTEKLSILVFEFGSNQSLKVKIKLQKAKE